MGKVSPIRSQGQIAQMKEFLKKRSDRDYLLFVMGINIGIRIGDLVKLTAEQVSHSHLTLIEEKRGKERTYFINAPLRKEIDSYINERNLRPEDYLFKSRQGGQRPITRSQAFRILRSAAVELGIENVGTHTLRKTFGYWNYKQFKDVAMLQLIFGHSSPTETLRYIGIEQDEIDSVASSFYL